MAAHNHLVTLRSATRLYKGSGHEKRKQLVRCRMQFRFALSEASCMNRACVPYVITHALPRHGPSCDFAVSAEDVSPSRANKHAALGNVTENVALRTCKKRGRVRRIMIMQNNRKMLNEIGIGKMLIQGAGRSTCRDSPKKRHTFQTEVGPW